MRLHIVAVGKVKQAGLRAELDDYLGRLRRYAACEEVELKDADEAALAARFERAIPARAYRVALEVDGKAWTSQQLADFLGRSEQQNVAHVAWLIGGAFGLPADVRATADLRLSLSAMTFPHRLARLMLAEQLYRGFTILRNEPYAH